MDCISTHAHPHRLYHKKVLSNGKIYSECQRGSSNSTLPPTLCCSHSVNIFLQKEDTYRQWRYATFYPGTTSVTLGLKQEFVFKANEFILTKYVLLSFIEPNHQPHQRTLQSSAEFPIAQARLLYHLTPTSCSACPITSM